MNEQIETENKPTTAKRNVNTNANIIEKHIKDNSFKLNSSLSQLNLQKRKKDIEQVIDIAPILQLKAINSNSSFKKGSILTITCQGLEKSINDQCRKDGFVYFGYYPKDYNGKEDQDVDVLLSNMNNNCKNINNDNDNDDINNNECNNNM